MTELELLPAGRVITGQVQLAGSKSVTNRALILAALADGESRLRGASSCDDTRALRAGLSSLGIDIKDVEGGLQVRGGLLRSHDGTIDVGPAGTAYRFLLPLCCVAAGSNIVLTGDARMQQRPVGDLVDGLRQLGASLEFTGVSGCPPVRVLGKAALDGGALSVRSDLSSQFLSALLMVAPCCHESLQLTVPGVLVSSSYVELTVEMMARFGVRVCRDGGRFTVARDARYVAQDYQVAGDASGATYFWGLAAVTGGVVSVRGLGVDGLQGDARFPELLARMGCEVESGADAVTVRGTDQLVAIDADMTEMPDAAQTLAVVASQARGESILRGLSTLRHKETDRVAALVTELSRLGVVASAEGDVLRIQGGPVQGGLVETYGDHRMAMAFSLLGAKHAGIRIARPEVVSKSYPEFWRELERLGVEQSRSER